MKNRINRYNFYHNKVSIARNVMKNCKKCNGKGILPSGTITKDIFDIKDCKCKLRYMEVKSYILANVPRKRFSLLDSKIKKRTVINILTGEKKNLFKEICNKYIGDFDEASENGIGLIFFGQPGRGKTVASLYILMNLLSKGVNGYYIYFKDLIALLIESYEDRSKKPLFSEITNVDLLVIDELSLVSRVTTHMIAEFTSICKQRFESCKPTILVSNYQTIDEIGHNFGPPIESLMNEAFIPIKFGGKRDLREDKYEYMKEFF
uniref:Putative IstB domain protein ATP-binding protein n=1 Tax=viral metagenome TaxID=1070528 RepID=A0A6M3KZX9_9ZZZZ